MSKKSNGICWYFFVSNIGVKANKKNYCQHLLEELFYAIEKVVKSDDWIFAKDGGHLVDPTWCNIFLTKN